MAGIAALAIAYVLSQFYRSFLAVLTPALTVELGATKADLSAASGAYFIAFALAQFGIGVALDRYGPRRTAALLLGASAGGGAFLFSAAVEPWMIIAAMGLFGIGCAPVLMSSYFIFARVYSPARFAVLASWIVAFGTAGNVIGAAPLANAAEAFGWRPVMVALGIVTIAVAAALLLIVRDPQPSPDAPEAADGSGFAGYVDLIRMRVLWPLIPLVALNYAAAAGIRGLWAGPYLAEVYGADTIAIGDATFFMALSMVAGAFLYGPLDTLFGTRKWVSFVGNTVGVIVLLWLALNPAGGVATTTASLVLIGLFGASFGLMMAHARAFLPPHLVGRGVTLMNFFSIGGVGLMQFATGWVVTANTTSDEPTAAYSALFLFYAGVLAFSLIVYLSAKDAPPSKVAVA
ncbi:MAG: MFS transporter [Rhizobiaceae bacterium]